MIYKIEKHIPFKKLQKTKYPWIDMEVGYSFLAYDYNDAGKQAALYSTARDWSRVNTRGVWKFATRQTKEGLRIWRIE